MTDVVIYIESLKIIFLCNLIRFIFQSAIIDVIHFDGFAIIFLAAYVVIIN